MAYFLSCYEGVGDGFLFFTETLVVATLGLASMGFFFLRRSRHEALIRTRIARGECVRCGYPLGAAERCSECGCAASPNRQNV